MVFNIKTSVKDPHFQCFHFFDKYAKFNKNYFEYCVSGSVLKKY